MNNVVGEALRSCQVPAVIERQHQSSGNPAGKLG